MVSRRSLFKGAVAGFITAGMGARDLLAQLIGSRYKFTMDSGPGPETMINGKRCLYFGGTGYFGFQTHPELIQAAQKGLAEFGMCTATSRNIFGTSPLHLEVEKKAREFFGSDDDDPARVAPAALAQRSPPEERAESHGIRPGRHARAGGGLGAQDQ